MSDEREPPASVVTDLRVAHLTKAETRKGEIRFELHVPENDSASDLAGGLSNAFFLRLVYAPAREGPISVDESERDPSKITVVYKPHGRRDPDADMRSIVTAFADMDVPVTAAVNERIGRAFDALKALGAPGPGTATAAEAARRTARKAPDRQGGR
jgi:hypothetical protein